VIRLIVQDVTVDCPIIYFSELIIVEFIECQEYNLYYF